MTDEQLAKLEKMHADVAISAVAEIFQHFPEIAKELREARAERDNLAHELKCSNETIDMLYQRSSNFAQQADTHEAEAKRLKEIVETYDDRFATLYDEKGKEIAWYKERSLEFDEFALAIGYAERPEGQSGVHRMSGPQLVEVWKAREKEIDELRSDRALSLTFRRFRDHKPAHGQQIVYLEVRRFYGNTELRFGTVDYQWEELDPVEDNTPTGNSFTYEEGGAPPENCRLTIFLDHGVASHTMQDDDLWAPVEAVQNLVDPEEK